MDQKKRNSTLRTFPKEDEHTTDFNVRPKRRISFREKKSVRVFCHEEDATTWNNSYELSDRGDSSINSNTKSRNSSEIKVQSTSALCTTNEFIDKSNQGDIFVENSLGITLTDFELNTIKKGFKNPTSQNVNESDNPTVKPKLGMSKAKKILEIPHDSAAPPPSTSSAVNFVYINENSNKENIAPETLEILDTGDNKKNTKSTDIDRAAISMDLDASTTNLHNFEIFKKYKLSSSTNHKEKKVAQVAVEKAKTNLKRKKPLKTNNENIKKVKSKFW